MKKILKRIICFFRGHKWFYAEIKSIKVFSSLHDEREIFCDWERIDIYKCARCGKTKTEWI